MYIDDLVHFFWRFQYFSYFLYKYYNCLNDINNYQIIKNILKKKVTVSIMDHAYLEKEHYFYHLNQLFLDKITDGIIVSSKKLLNIYSKKYKLNYTIFKL